MIGDFGSWPVQVVDTTFRERLTPVLEPRAPRMKLLTGQINFCSEA